MQLRLLISSSWTISLSMEPSALISIFLVRSIAVFIHYYSDSVFKHMPFSNLAVAYSYKACIIIMLYFSYTFVAYSLHHCSPLAFNSSIS